MTPHQLKKLKEAIRQNESWTEFPMTGDGHYNLANELNKPAIPRFMVWRTDIKPHEILGAMNLSTYVPKASVYDWSKPEDVQVFIAKSLVIQIKQSILNMIVGAKDVINMSMASSRSALMDAVTNIPSGDNGKAENAGGVDGKDVLNACTRQATFAEKILFAGPNTSDTTGTVTARVLDFEGFVTPADVQKARELL